MGQLNITKNYQDAKQPLKSWFDAFYESIETFFNITKASTDNIQDSSALTAKLDNDSVTEAKLYNNAVTDAKLSDSGSDDSLRAVGTDHMQALAASTAKFASQTVTRAYGSTDNASDYADSERVTGIAFTTSFELLVSTSFVTPTIGATKVLGLIFTPRDSAIQALEVSRGIDHTMEFRIDGTPIAQIITNGTTAFISNTDTLSAIYYPILCDGSTKTIAIYGKNASGSAPSAALSAYMNCVLVG